MDYVTIRGCLWIMLLQGVVCGLCYYKGLSVDYVTERLAVEYGPGGLCGLCYYKGLSGLCYYKGLSVDYVTTRGCLWIMLLQGTV